MDISARIQQIIELMEGAKSMPLSSSVLVNQQEILELLDAALKDLPEEIKQARWVVKDREELLAKARRDAQAIVERAQAEQARLVAGEEVARAAREEADRILTEAREMARQMRLEAEDYVDAKLAQYEIVLDKTHSELERSMAQVRRGRDKLRGVTPAQEEFGPPEDDQEQG